MNRPEGISPEAWSKAVDLVMDAKAERVPYYSTSEEIRDARLADATAIALAIQSAVEAERERLAALAENFMWFLPVLEQGTDPNAASDDAACSVQEQIAAAIRKGA